VLGQTAIVAWAIIAELRIMHGEGLLAKLVKGGDVVNGSPWPISGQVGRGEEVARAAVPLL
jgi:hypothetical protein